MTETSTSEPVFKGQVEEEDRMIPQGKILVMTRAGRMEIHMPGSLVDEETYNPAQFMNYDERRQTVQIPMGQMLITKVGDQPSVVCNGKWAPLSQVRIGVIQTYDIDLAQGYMLCKPGK